MAGYIGSKASVVSSGAERKKTFAITTSTTSLTGLSYTPTKVHVFHNGVRLVDGTDYTATNGTSITLTVAAENGDQVVVVSYATFQTSDTVSASAGGTFAGNVAFGANATFGDNDKAIFGAGSDLQIYHDGSQSYIDDAGTGRLNIRANDRLYLRDTNDSVYAVFYSGAGSFINHNGNTKLSTTSTGIDVTGTVTADGLTVQNTNDVTTNTAEFRNDNGNRTFRFAQNTAGDADLLLEKNDGTDAVLISTHGNSYFNGGNLLVGKASSSTTTAGNELRAGGLAAFTRSGSYSLNLNRLASDGDIAVFQKNGTTVGSIGNFSTTVIYLAGNANGLKIVAPAAGVDAFGPSTTNGSNRDNTMDIGWSSNRFDDIFATNGTIQTSDANEKQDVAALTATEMLVAASISGLFKTFRWIDSVADKGDNARTHTGVIAQDVQAAFIAEGLDAGDYALFTSATWWETQTDVAAVEADEDNEIEAADAYTRTDTFDTLDEAPDGATERTRMGIRYPELLAFVGAYNEQRFASIETRLAALEAV